MIRLINRLLYLITFNRLKTTLNFGQVLKKTREIFSTDAFKDYLGAEISPGVSVNNEQSLNRFIQETLRSTKHPCGTCRMGQDDYAVVDEVGKVHGITGLRVVDASIMPHITSGNTNAPTIMIAEKIADQILGLEALSVEPNLVSPS